MVSNKSNWLILRIAILIVAMVQAQSFSNSLSGDFSKSNWTTFFVLIGFVAFGVFFVTSIQSKNPCSPSEWRRPSWFTNPFVFGQPLLIFDFAAYYFLVLGLVSAFFEVSSEPPRWAWEIPLSVGIGSWIGVRLCLVAFRENFID